MSIYETEVVEIVLKPGTQDALKLLKKYFDEIQYILEQTRHVFAPMKGAEHATPTIKVVMVDALHLGGSAVTAELSTTYLIKNSFHNASDEEKDTMMIWASEVRKVLDSIILIYGKVGIAWAVKRLVGRLTLERYNPNDNLNPEDIEVRAFIIRARRSP